MCNLCGTMSLCGKRANKEISNFFVGEKDPTNEETLIPAYRQAGINH